MTPSDVESSDTSTCKVRRFRTMPFPTPKMTEILVKLNSGSTAGNPLPRHTDWFSSATYNVLKLVALAASCHDNLDLSFFYIHYVTLRTVSASFSAIYYVIITCCVDNAPRALLPATLWIDEDQQWNKAWRWSDLEWAGTQRLQSTVKQRYTHYNSKVLHNERQRHFFPFSIFFFDFAATSEAYLIPERHLLQTSEEYDELDASELNVCRLLLAHYSYHFNLLLIFRTKC